MVVWSHAGVLVHMGQHEGQRGEGWPAMRPPWVALCQAAPWTPTGTPDPFGTDADRVVSVDGGARLIGMLSYEPTP